MSKVSVLIPVYNSASYIEEAVGSVLQQTYSDVEVLVIDDGSTDNTEEVLRPFAKKISYIKKENGGPASARNLGIEKATGGFIAFLDADDIWEPQKLEKQMKAFEDQSVGLVYSRVVKINEDNIPVISTVQTKRYSGEVFESLFWKNFIPTSTVIVRKECFDLCGNFDEDKELISVEDYDMWLRIATRFKVTFVDEPLVRYRIHEAKISKNVERSYMGEKKIIERVCANFYDKFPFLKISQTKRLAFLFYELGMEYFNSDRIIEAKRNFKKSIYLNPFQLKTLGYYMSTVLGKNWINLCRSLKS